MQSDNNRPFIRRYSVAGFSTGLALTLCLQLVPLTSLSTSYLLFYAAIALSAWYGGLLPGLVATALSGFFSAYFQLPPVVRNAVDIPSLVIFLLVGGLISVLMESLHRAAGEKGQPKNNTDHKSVEEALRESEQRLQAVLDNTALVSVYIKDVEGHYLFVNRGFERAYGRSRSEILGRTDYDLSTPQFAASFRAHDMRILALSEPLVVEEEVKTCDGIPVTYWSSKFPLLDARGRAYATCGISTDITERKKAEQAVLHLLVQEREARAQAEAANQAKDEFLAVLSHELRTPLTAILGWTYLLRNQLVDGNMSDQAIEVIERSAQSQTRLIEDLLDVSRAISGTLSITARPMEIAPVITDAVDALRPLAQEKKIDVQVLLETEVSTVAGDAARLQQVVWNLLSNAIKFTPEGGCVEVQLMQSGGWVHIIVSDNGQGINPEFLPDVFKRFHQADSSSTRAHGGLGLGLSIVRHLVELHGGQVKAESPGEGQGATFTVSLPVDTIHAPAHLPARVK